MKHTVSAFMMIAMIAGCASKSEDIAATYVSPSVYDRYDCDQLLEERARLTAKVTEVSKAQDDKADNDAIAAGVGTIVFLPALLFLASGTDREAELSSLKGNYDAVQESLIKNECLSPEQIEAERKAVEEAKRKLEEQKRKREEETEYGD